MILRWLGGPKPIIDGTPCEPTEYRVRLALGVLVTCTDFTVLDGCYWGRYPFRAGCPDYQHVAWQAFYGSRTREVRELIDAAVVLLLASDL